MSWPIRLTEDVFPEAELRDALPGIIDKAVETKRPMIIVKDSRPVAAIIDVEELQRLYDRIDDLEDHEDRLVVEAFVTAEAQGEIEWLSNEDMASFVEQICSRAEKGA